MTVTLKSYKQGEYYVELATEERYGNQVYIASMARTYNNGISYKTVKENATGKRENAMATYRRYIKELTR